MKEAFTRLLYAAALAALSMAACNTRLNAPIAYHVGSYVAYLTLWTVPLQAILIVQNVIHNRRLRLENADTKELPVPDTQPLDRK